MNMKKLASILGTTLLTAVCGMAQDKPGNIAALEFQTPKNGMVKQYEEGRKQKAEWHKQQKDTQPLYVWEIVSGEQTGTYIVGRLGQHWADLDKPSVPDQADLDEYNKVIGAAVQSLVTRYFAYLPKVSNPGDGKPTDKYSEIITYHVRAGKEAEFNSALARANEAIQKTKWSTSYTWLTLANGGRAGTYVLILNHKNWADFEDKPDMKPFLQMLIDAFGPEEAESINKRFDASIDSITTEIDKFRADLSYLPNK
jgi:hypothetical protein